MRERGTMASCFHPFEDVGKSDGGVEVGATDFPEENIEDPEA